MSWLAQLLIVLSVIGMAGISATIAAAQLRKRYEGEEE